MVFNLFCFSHPGKKKSFWTKKKKKKKESKRKDEESNYSTRLANNVLTFGGSKKT